MLFFPTFAANIASTKKKVFEQQLLEPKKREFLNVDKYLKNS